jgi:hypothetical protein
MPLLLIEVTDISRNNVEISGNKLDIKLKLEKSADQGSYGDSG